MGRARLAALFFLLALAWLALAPPAWAQANDEAAAEALFREGKALMDEGKLPEACAKLADSQKLDAASGTLLNLALCYEKRGMIASAWAEYRRAAALAKTEGREDREAGATKLADKLEPRLPKLKIAVAEPTPGLVVRRDGTEVGSATLGAALPVDPGEHLIEAQAPDHEPWSTRVTVEEAKEQAVLVPALTKTAQPKEPARPPPPAPKPGPKPDAGTSVGPLHVAGIVVASIGVVFLGAGIGLGVKAMNERKGLEEDDDLCPDFACSEEGLKALDDAEGRANMATLMFAISGAHAVTATILLIVGSTSSSSGKAAMVAVPWVTAGGGGVTVGGRF